MLFNGEFLPANAPCISVQDRGLRYGDGVFTTISVYQGRPYQWEAHLARLREALTVTGMPPLADGLADECQELLKRNAVNEGLLRIMVTRGVGGRGYLPPERPLPNVMVETFPKPPLQNTISLWLSAYEKIPPRCLPPHIKHAQGLNPTLARMEAAREHCDEALLLNAAGEICEATSANIFWLKNEILHTPATGPIYPGTVREAVLRLSPYKTRQTAYALAELEHAEAVVLTSVSLEITAVASLKPHGWHWQSEGLAAALRQALHRDIAAYGLGDGGKGCAPISGVSDASSPG